MNILESLTNYHLINHLIPGSLLTWMLIDYGFIKKPNEFYILLSLSYFIGVVINRLSSVVVESVLVKFNIIEKHNYYCYVKAVKEDKKLDILSEVCNMYRIYLTLSILMLIINKFKKKLLNLFFNSILILLIVVFYLSFKKQINFINIRINCSESLK